MAWRCLHWRLRTGSCAVGTEPYRTTTCPVVWAAGLARTGTRIFIVLLGVGCSVEDAGEGPSYSVMLCDRLEPSTDARLYRATLCKAECVPSVVDVAELRRAGKGYVPRYAL